MPNAERHQFAPRQQPTIVITPPTQVRSPIEIARALGEISHALSDRVPLYTLLERLVAAVGSLLQVDRATIFLYGRDEFVLANAAWGLGGPAVRLTASLTDVERSVKDTGAPVIVNDTRDAAPNPYFDALGIRSSMSLPMSVNESVIGMLCLHSIRAPRTFTDDDVVLASAFANQAAVAILNNQLFDRIASSHDRMLALYQTGRAMGASLEIRHVARVLLGAVLAQPEVRGAALTLSEPVASDPFVAGSAAFREWRRSVRREPLALGPTPATATTPAGCPGELTGISIALTVTDGVSGTLEVFGRTRDGLEEVHPVLLAMAQHAAAALRNAMLYRRLEEAGAQLDELLSALTRAREEEARRVAYDVHDGVAQTLVAAHQHLESALAASTRNDHSLLDTELARGRDLVKRGITETRAIVSRLHPPGLDDLGLVGAVRAHCSEIARQTGMEISVRSELAPRRFPSTVEVALFRVLQEALNNAWRHGRATSALVAIQLDAGRLVLVVDDNGTGVSKPLAVPDSRSGYGLRGMQERTRLLGGTVRLESSPLGGARLVAEVPLETEPSAGRVSA